MQTAVAVGAVNVSRRIIDDPAAGKGLVRDLGHYFRKVALPQAEGATVIKQNSNNSHASITRTEAGIVAQYRDISLVSRDPRSADS